MNSHLLPTSYLAPISYYALLLSADKIEIELHEHFQKQTPRSRCSIYSPNGLQQLIIPLDGRKDKSLTRDIKISNENPWQKLHWRSLESAYRSSPYFEFYEHDLIEFYANKYELLFEFNNSLQNKILELLKIKKEFSYTLEYKKIPTGIADHRDHLTKKNLNLSNNFPRYIQVFEDKHGFLPNLSIADLLFNLGPDSVDYLKQISTG